MNDHLNRLLTLCERQGGARGFCRQQNLHPDSRDYGALFLDDKGFAEPSTDCSFVGLLALYYHPDAQEYGQADLLKRSVIMMEHLLSNQNADGTLDLRETNFYDATSAAFTVRSLWEGWMLLERFSQHTPLEDQLTSQIETFYRRAGEGMLSGGFHTPNHRWVMASALAEVWVVTGDPRLLKEVQLYLDEGIDQNPDGDYTEQSVSVYDSIVNESLITLATHLGKEKLLEYVRRNLEKLPCHLEPDGTVNTLNSRRQDYGVRAFPTCHYWSCLFLAHHDQSPFFAALAEQLLCQMEKNGVGVSFNRLMADPLYAQSLPVGQIPVCYHRYLPHSGMLRWREENTTLTLLKDNPVFLKYQVGGLPVLMRFCGSFYAQGQFQAGTLEPVTSPEGTVGYRMAYRRRWGYWRPMGEKAAGREWKDIPRAERKPVNQQEYEIVVTVFPFRERLVLEVEADCRYASVPCKLELLLPPDGLLESQGLYLSAKGGDFAVLRGDVRYALGGDGLQIRGGIGEHLYTETMRGSLPAAPGMTTLCCTFMTPKRVCLELSPCAGYLDFPIEKQEDVFH